MITVFIPIYNGVEFFEESLTSVITQTFTEWELIIGINGHPLDSSVYQIIQQKVHEKEYHYSVLPEKIRILQFDPDKIKGKSATLNEMLLFAKYPWIALLDVDDIWNYQKLAFQLPYLENYDVIGTRCVWFGEINNTVPPIPHGDITYYNMSIMNPIINSSALIRKELCYWSDNILEDYDMWLRLSKEKKRFYNLPQILVKHRIHNTSAFNSKITHDDKVDLLKKHFPMMKIE
jgi:glycosyltransferase involved in cell wall biosynthesis